MRRMLGPRNENADYRCRTISNERNIPPQCSVEYFIYKFIPVMELASLKLALRQRGCEMAIVSDIGCGRAVGVSVTLG